MDCKICDQEMEELFTHKILKKYDVRYYSCKHCGYMCTEEPYWLEEAYESALTCLDTGVMKRNIEYSRIVSFVIHKYFDIHGKFVDYAGGYGILTRLMRDIGYDFYWKDKYAPNLVAQGFEWDGKGEIEGITSMEALEHFVKPLHELEQMLQMTKTIIFSTELIPNEKPPKPDEWWYYVFESGQHISFYSLKTLQYIAKKYKLKYYSCLGLHILTDKKMSIKKWIPIVSKIVFKIEKIGMKQREIKYSKTISDMEILRVLETKQ